MVSRFYPKTKSILPPDHDPNFSQEDLEKMAAMLAPKISVEEAKDAIGKLSDEGASEESQCEALITLFAANVFSGATIPVEHWVLEELAERLYDAIRLQCSTADTLPLPWDPRGRPTAAERNYVIWQDVTGLTNKGAGIVDAIQQVADFNSVSYETAKKAYYDHEKNYIKNFRKAADQAELRLMELYPRTEEL